MRERALLIGAALDIRSPDGLSATGTGTRVRLTVPAVRKQP